MKKEVLVAIILISLIVFVNPELTGDWHKFFQRSRTTATRSTLQPTQTTVPAAPTIPQPPTQTPTTVTAPTSPTTTAQPTAPTCIPGIESPLALNCNDGIDNDCDGLVDNKDPTYCQPPSPTASATCGARCGTSLPCPTGMVCDISLCTASYCPENTVAFCNDRSDNDRDGATDCFDSNCIGIGFCSFETSCGNLFDDDWDGAIDCADPDCVNYCSEADLRNCRDQGDNDGDGLVDFQEASCAFAWTENFGAGCSDGLDGDNDGQTDCADISDCGTLSICSEGKSTGMIASCFDNIDNDGDGLVDCIFGRADPDCTNSGACTEIGNCGDGVDNDGDNLLDCLDINDCTGVGPCPSCIETDGGNIFVQGTINMIGFRVGYSSDACGWGPLYGGPAQVVLLERTCPVASQSYSISPQQTVIVCPTGICNNGRC